MTPCLPPGPLTRNAPRRGRSSIAGGLSGKLWYLTCSRWSWPILPATFEVLADDVHSHQQDERDRRQDKAGGVGTLGMEALNAFLDVERGRLGVADHVARDGEDSTEFAQRPGHRQGHSVGDAPPDRG